MLESILYFLLGFLSAALLALMVSPVIWQRAVSLTKKRIERSVPLTLNEIQADKDQMRAEFAMSTRRLEMSVEELREKAATQIIEINRKRDSIAKLAEEHNEKLNLIEELQTKSGELRVQLLQREEQLETANKRLSESQKKLEEQALSAEKLRQNLHHVKTESDSAKIELVAKQTALENMSDRLEFLDITRGQSADSTVNEIQIELAQTKVQLESEKNSAYDFKNKYESAAKQLTQTSEQLERSERELLRMRKSVGEDGDSNLKLTSQLVDLQSMNVELEAKLAQANLQMEALLSDASNENVEKAMSSLEDEKSNLAEKLVDVSRERDKLVEELSRVSRNSNNDWESERRENSILRERINDLAAQVTAMTASLEGDGSPINEILSRQDNTNLPADADEKKATKDTKEQAVTLADRIRALQDVAG